MGKHNLTDSVRQCGILGSLSSALMRDCLLSLGFIAPCVTIWEWNIVNTKRECFEICLISYISGERNNKPDGSLNDCLQCDEDRSGPNFKYFSGRTRRNSGIISAIHRPANEVYSWNTATGMGTSDTNTDTYSLVVSGSDILSSLLPEHP